MITEHTVAEAAAAAGISVPARFAEETGSTNEDLLRMADEDAPSWTVVVAGQQTRGRGRLGRSWVSEPGSSLLVSVLIRPSLPPDRAPLLSLAAGAAMALACREATSVQVTCKWPNDLMASERKIGGILVEGKVSGDRLDHAVIGTGVNVAQEESDFPDQLRDSSTSVALEGGRPDIVKLLYEFLRRMRRDFDPEGERFATHVPSAYSALCGTLGRRVAASATDGRRVEGVATSIAETGALIVTTDHGPEVVQFGEVAHLNDR